MIYLTPLACPTIFLLAAAYAFSPRAKPRTAATIVENAAIATLLVSAFCVAILLGLGAGTSTGAGSHLDILASRIDVVSVAMLLLVSFISWTVVRYSQIALDTENGQARFMGWMATTIAAVLLAVQSESFAGLLVGWVGSSIALNKLLLFYSDRPKAGKAAHQAFLFARGSDLAMVAALVLLWWTDGSLQLSSLQVSQSTSVIHWAAGLLAVAALLRSAQFPTHGWLTQVMETPTPVSALLHAGVVNGGGFLLIRFADIMVQAPAVLAALIILGGFTALFGSVVMLTQPAIKTSLAWSTVAQMGFMILQCGLALFPLALLHIIAHSLYKAHAFLASGSAVEQVLATRRPGPVSSPSMLAVGKSFAIAIGVYLFIGIAFGITEKPPQAIALGTILIFGIAYLVAQGMAETAPRSLTLRTTMFSLCTAVAYFALQHLLERLTAGALPAPPPAGPLEWTLIVLALLSFGAIAVMQALLPKWAHHPACAGLRVHASNGFYVQPIVDKLLRSTGATSAAQTITKD